MNSPKYLVDESVQGRNFSEKKCTALYLEPNNLPAEGPAFKLDNGRSGGLKEWGQGMARSRALWPQVSHRTFEPWAVASPPFSILI